MQVYEYVTIDHRQKNSHEKLEISMRFRARLC